MPPLLGALPAERAINHGDTLAESQQLGAQIQHLTARERDQRIAGFEVAQPDRGARRTQGRFAFQRNFVKRIVAEFRDAPDERNAIRCAQNIEMTGRNAHDRRRPGSATVGVHQHLRLINQRDIDWVVKRAHFDRRRQMARTGKINALFARGQRSRHPA